MGRTRRRPPATSRLSSTGKSCTATSSSSRRIRDRHGVRPPDRCSRPARSSFAAICRRSRSMKSPAGSTGRRSGFGFYGSGVRWRPPRRATARIRCLPPVTALAGNQFAYAIPQAEARGNDGGKDEKLHIVVLCRPATVHFNNCGEELTAAGSIRRATNTHSLLTMTTQPSSPRMPGIQYAAASGVRHCRLCRILDRPLSRLMTTAGGSDLSRHCRARR